MEVKAINKIVLYYGENKISPHVRRLEHDPEYSNILAIIPNVVLVQQEVFERGSGLFEVQFIQNSGWSPFTYLSQIRHIQYLCHVTGTCDISAIMTYSCMIVPEIGFKIGFQNCVCVASNDDGMPRNRLKEIRAVISNLRYYFIWLISPAPSEDQPLYFIVLLVVLPYFFPLKTDTK